MGIKRARGDGILSRERRMRNGEEKEGNISVFGFEGI